MTGPAVEFGLPHDGVRVRMSPRGRFWSLAWIVAIVTPSLSAVFFAGLSGGLPGLATSC